MIILKEKRAIKEATGKNLKEQTGYATASATAYKLLSDLSTKAIRRGQPFETAYSDASYDAWVSETTQGILEGVVKWLGFLTTGEASGVKNQIRKDVQDALSHIRSTTSSGGIK
jgi:hypothetical protein